ncbi:hypothetical protein PIB30_044928 [Stylosanthes scabra]|uniref:Uncharacterized protein n=1 Tax=Stylosanthes scabra TaxID=79078 RepID=A0ABU6ZEP8_9FABA|nr:hypothetical protein [Stylosanthes scabra]
MKEEMSPCTTIFGISCGEVVSLCDGDLQIREEVRTQSSSSSTTKDKKSQSLWQSSSVTGFTGLWWNIEEKGLETLRPLKKWTLQRCYSYPTGGATGMD